MILSALMMETQRHKLERYEMFGKALLLDWLRRVPGELPGRAGGECAREQLRMNNLSKNFQTVDHARAGPAEECRAIDYVNSARLHRRQIVESAFRGEPIDFADRPRNLVATRHDYENLGREFNHLLPVDRN